MTETLYLKKGRRYIPWGNVEDWHRDGDRMEAGTFRLTHCVGDGSTRYHHQVTPDTAAFLAAADLARVAMEEAMSAAAIAAPDLGATPYTPRQLELIEQFRRDMAAAGGLIPSYWTHATAREIAQAGIDAVRRYGNG